MAYGLRAFEFDSVAQLLGPELDDMVTNEKLPSIMMMLSERSPHPSGPPFSPSGQRSATGLLLSSPVRTSALLHVPWWHW